MKNVFLSFPEFIRLGALALGLGMQMHVFAGTGENTPTTTLPALPADLTELKFRDIFIMPVGPHGLELNPKLLALDGRRVRILGYMAQEEAPRPGFLMLTPVPVQIADSAGDIPPAALFVHLPPSQVYKVAAHQPGLLVLTGTLRVGDHEVDGRISMLLDAPSHERSPISPISL